VLARQRRADRVPDEVHASMLAVQRSPAQAVADRAGTDARGERLPASDQAVLACRDARQRAVDRLLDQTPGCHGVTGCAARRRHVHFWSFCGHNVVRRLGARDRATS
jgi:hypothetical protein